MPHARLIWNLVIAQVVVVILLNLLLRRLRNASRNLLLREREVGDLALLGHRLSVLRGVLLVERFQIAVRRIDRLAQVVGRDHRVVELDLDVRFAVEIADLLVAHRHTCGNQCLQAAHRDLFLDLVLKLVDRYVQPIVDQLLVSFFADEFPIGIDNLPRGTGAQVLAHIVVRGVHAELVRFLQKHLLLHQLLAHLLLKVLHDHRIAGVLRAALAQLALRNLLHVRLADGVAGRQNLAVPVRIHHREGIGRGGAGPG